MWTNEAVFLNRWLFLLSNLVRLSAPFGSLLPRKELVARVPHPKLASCPTGRFEMATNKISILKALLMGLLLLGSAAV
ncbi:MAG: hypothetical protein EBV24_11575, partial [Actinobacteria bacterium]|nr:hypothetical protein [Actinomycetota bacterium]